MRLTAPSLMELFVEAGLALAELMAGGPPPPPTAEYETVTLHAPDRDALLVDWLNELIYRAETDHRVFTRFQVELIDDQHVVAGIQGADLPEMRTFVKAATFHGLNVTETEGGYSATVVLDV